MKTMIASALKESKRAQGCIPIKILLAYDGLGNGKHGKECCDRLLQDFKKKHHRVDAYISILKLGLLYDSQFQQRWRTAALEADMVVMSVQHETPLPDFVKHWMGEWMSQRIKNPAVMIALLNRQKTEFIRVSPVQRYLQEFLRNESVALFTLFRECAEDAHQNHQDSIRHRTIHLSQTLREAMKPHTSLEILERNSPGCSG